MWSEQRIAVRLICPTHPNVHTTNCSQACRRGERRSTNLGVTTTWLRTGGCTVIDCIGIQSASAWEGGTADLGGFIQQVSMGCHHGSTNLSRGLAVARSWARSRDRRSRGCGCGCGGDVSCDDCDRCDICDRRSSPGSRGWCGWFSMLIL